MILEKDKKLLGGCKLYQIPHIGFVQMMGVYVRRYPRKSDRNRRRDAAEAEFLEKLILSKNKTVAAWFLTHAHDDHITAITEIINRGAVKIEKIYFHLISGYCRLIRARSGSKPFWKAAELALLHSKRECG